MIFGLVIVAMAAINAFRGGRIIPDEDLPGRNLYYAIPLVGIVAWLLFPPVVAVAWAAAYGLWGAFSWGHLIGMGFHAPARKMPDHERACMALAAGWPPGAMFWRELYILPGLFAVAWLLQAWWVPVLAIPFGIGAAGARRLCWEAAPRRAIMLGEVLEGVAWGILLGVVAYGVG